MKKRLRKKLRLREFQEMGFEVQFDFTHEKTEEKVYAFWDEKIEFVESQGLFIGGGMTNFFATADYRKSAKPEQREALLNWLNARADVKDVVVGPLRDAWHGNFD